MRKVIPLILLVVQGLFAQSGIIQGRITNARDGTPLIGVNVMIMGTYYGGSTDMEGWYSITGLPAGSYDIEVSYIGFKIIQKTGVIMDGSSTLQENFDMEETALSFGRDVVVIGKRPLFDVSETSSSTKLSRADLDNMIVDNVVDILGQSGGVSTTDNEVHVRGGRLDETLFIIDGLATKDPLTGYSANLYINADAIEEMEVLTGGFNAEYGDAMSGVVNVKLKEGSETFDGSLKIMGDGIGNISNYGTRRIEFNLGGPSVLENMLARLGVHIPGNLYFFLNGYGKVTDTFLPVADKLYPHQNLSFQAWDALDDELGRLLDNLAIREENDWHAMFKSTWRITPRIQWSNSYDVSVNINQGYHMPRAFSNTYYPYNYQQILDNYNTVTRTALFLNSNFVHTLSAQSFYEVKFGRFVSREHSAVQDLHWTDYVERLDLEPNIYTPRAGDGEIVIIYGDEFYDTGMSPEWYDTYSDVIMLKGDWTYSYSDRRKRKTGFEGNWAKLQVLDINEPWIGTTGLGENYDIYNVRTHNGNMYIQEKVVFEGMIVNLGMRYDYWVMGSYLENVVNDTDIVTAAARQKFYDDSYPILGKQVKGYLSPRLGISHPVTDNDVLYFYYGHFSQLPTFQYVFAKLNTSSRSTYQIIGNPTLNPKTTVQYEIGVKHRFSEDQILELKAYWKNMYNYETSQTITSENPRYANQSFNMYFNADYARSRGVEAVLRLRFLENFRAEGNFSYSIATGKSSSPNDNLLVQAGALSEKPLGENFLSWDRPVRAFGNLSYYRPRSAQSGLFSWDDWGTSVRLDYETGRRYTSQTLITGDGPRPGIIVRDGTEYWNGTPNSDNPNDRISEKARFVVDMRIYKNIAMGGTSIRILFEVENVFDNRTPRRINPFTGRGFDPGETFSQSLRNYPNPNYNPSRYDQPRTAEIGIQIFF